MNADFDYCTDLVRKRDRDRYWCALLAPGSNRNDLFTLYALNAEISEIGISVSEPLIGHMRLRWWLDALEPISAGNPPEHPVARALAAVLARTPIEKHDLVDYLETRQFDMDGSPFPTLDDVGQYALKTSSQMMTLSLTVIGSDDSAQHAAAEQLGLAWMLMGMIRSIPYQLRRGRVELPLDLCSEFNFDRQSFLDHGYRESLPTGLNELISRLIDEIKTHLNQSRRLWQSEKRSFPAPMLLRPMISGYLEELATVKNDPFLLNTHRVGPRVRDMITLKWQTLFGAY